MVHRLVAGMELFPSVIMLNHQGALLSRSFQCYLFNKKISTDFPSRISCTIISDANINWLDEKIIEYCTMALSQISCHKSLPESM